MSPAIVKLLRAVAAVVVLIVLLVVVQGWVGDYRSAPEPPAELSQPATDAEGASEADEIDEKPAAADAKAGDSAGTSAKTKRVVVLVDGLNLRLEPVATGAVIRGLKADETLVVLRKTGDWYYVRAASGTQGWISSNPSYTRTVKK